MNNKMAMAIPIPLDAIPPEMRKIFEQIQNNAMEMAKLHNKLIDKYTVLGNHREYYYSWLSDIIKEWKYWNEDKVKVPLCDKCKDDCSTDKCEDKEC